VTAAMLVVERDATHLEANALRVWLEAILLQVAARAA